MSRLIIEMEMPKIPQNCGECKFHKPLYHTQYCVLEGKNCAPWKTKKDWCPIKGVLPEQHGDLIDRDEVKQKMIHYGFSAIDMTATEFCEDELQTVIAAERSET